VVRLVDMGNPEKTVACVAKICLGAGAGKTDLIIKSYIADGGKCG
jgi:hypothetical protein